MLAFTAAEQSDSRSEAVQYFLCIFPLVFDIPKILPGTPDRKVHKQCDKEITISKVQATQDGKECRVGLLSFG